MSVQEYWYLRCYLKVPASEKGNLCCQILLVLLYFIWTDQLVQKQWQTPKLSILILRLSKPSNISCMPSPFPTHDKVKTFRMWCIRYRHHGRNFTSGCKSPLLAKIMIWTLAADKILLYQNAQLKSTILHTCQLYRYHERPEDGKWRH